MTKKLSAMAQRFTKEQKDQRAAKRVAIAKEKADREQKLNESILSPEIILALPAVASKAYWKVNLDGNPIAVVTVEQGSNLVTVHFHDGQGTKVEFQNVEDCKSLLTYRKVAAANMFPNGAVNLANMVRQRDAEAEAQKLLAVTGAPVSGRKNRL